MLAKHCQLTGLALHCGVPHMWRADGPDEVDFNVFLQHTERGRVKRVRRGNGRILALLFGTFWLKGRV